MQQTDQLWAVADIWGTNEIKIVDCFPAGKHDIDLVMQFINVQYITASNVRRHKSNVYNNTIIQAITAGSRPTRFYVTHSRPM